LREGGPITKFRTINVRKMMIKLSIPILILMLISLSGCLEPKDDDNEPKYELHFTFGTFGTGSKIPSSTNITAIFDSEDILGDRTSPYKHYDVDIKVNNGTHKIMMTEFDTNTTMTENFEVESELWIYVYFWFDRDRNSNDHYFSFEAMEEEPLITIDDPIK